MDYASRRLELTSVVPLGRRTTCAQQSVCVKTGNRRRTPENRVFGTESQRFQTKRLKMAEASASKLTKQDQKQTKAWQWTETELKYYAIFLTDDRNDFGHKLNMHALKNRQTKLSLKT